MAIEKGGSALRTVIPEDGADGSEVQHVAKHVAKKRAGAKLAAKAAAKSARHAGSGKQERDADLSGDLPDAFHHLHRAGAVISLLEQDSGDDLRSLLEHGIFLYRNAVTNPASGDSAQCASGLLRAAEHLAMAGLYSARHGYRTDVKAPALLKVQHHLDTLTARLDGLKGAREKEGLRLLDMAQVLLRRAHHSGDDPHLRYELVMAADGICSALEGGL